MAGGVHLPQRGGSQHGDLKAGSGWSIGIVPDAPTAFSVRGNGISDRAICWVRIVFILLVLFFFICSYIDYLKRILYNVLINTYNFGGAIIVRMADNKLRKR